MDSSLNILKKMKVVKLLSSKYTKGYSDGYKTGYQKAIEECRYNIEAMFDTNSNIWRPINMRKDVKIVSMGFSQRVLTILNRHHIYTIEELANKTVNELIAMNGCGSGSIAEIREKLAKYGSHLRNE